MNTQKLLIIDDSEDIHELVKVWLDNEALEFRSCFTGEDGLVVAPQLRPDLILLDVDLPGINGFEVCRQLKAAEATADIPIVFLTGAASTEEKLQGLELGAVDYVTKPFDPAELRARVRTSLNTRRLMDLLFQKAILEKIRAEVLEMIARGDPLNDILRQLILAVEKQEPNAIAAGVMLNGRFVHHCAPNLPSPISFSIERQMYSLIARFSALSAQNNDQIIVCDLLNDPAWEPLRPAVIEHGLRSCSSILILSPRRDPSGALSLYRRDNQSPSPSTVDLMKLAGDLISVAVEHHQLTDQLNFQARHDALTRLPNRAMFADRLDQALAMSARTNRPGAVIVFDVDRFKHVNDTYGHQAGDEMLCQVARRLGRRLRKSDTLARMGGDEFAMVLSELAKPEDADMVTKALLEEFTTPIDLRGRNFFVSVSMGSAVFPRDGSDSATLQKNADLALYQAKEAGRNTSRAFAPKMSEGAVERLELESALRLAVVNHELCLYYQPQVDCNGSIVGLEALVRWRHPQLGMIPPAKFIPLAEDSGLILQIGAWVLEEATRQTREWVASGIEVVPIAVNVSTLQFTQPGFISTIAHTLNGSGLPAQWLQIELTETVLMRNMCDAADKLSQLKQMQVKVAIDDFGTGYSSLAYLQRLSIDTLKIDRSFISTIDSPHNSGSGKTIITAIVSMAKSLGLRIIAEGVETEIQRQFLVDLGCDFLQGFLFSRPESPAMIAPLLKNRLIRISQPFALSA